MRAAPDRVLITYYDDAIGERYDVSAATLSSWVTRTANLLAAGLGLGRGDLAAILLRPHWQTAAVLLGVWSAGLTVDYHLAATAGLPRLSPGAHRSVNVTFVSIDRLNDMIEQVPEAPARFALGLAPTGGVLGDVPAGYRDYVAEVGTHSDATLPFVPIDRGDAATGDGTSYQQWGTLAQALAEVHGIRPGDRVLVNAADHEQPVMWLLAPLAAGASVVLCVNLDPDQVAYRTRAERVTHVL